MKKIICSLVFSSFFFVCAFGQEGITYNEAFSDSTMPTDEEIMQTIQKYNFDKSKQDYLFKETKKRLEEVYKTKNYDEFMKEQADKGIDPMAILPEVQKTDSNIEADPPSVQNPKKYAKHDKLGPKRNK